MAKKTPKRSKKTSKRAKAKTKTKPISRKKQPAPPGATRKALYRELERGGGPPGRAGGSRHAAGDPGSDIEEPEGETTTSSPPPLDEEEQDPLEQGPPYSGKHGGAVGGTPAELRASGGRARGGLAPKGIHRGDSTIGTNPKSGSE
jgi:hypothetical protein